MEEKWKILLYITPQGDSPVKEFGTNLSSPHIKKLAGTQLWELRVLGLDSIRIFYIAITGKTFLLLHGFKKKKDKTPPKEIKIAEERLVDHRSRTS